MYAKKNDFSMYQPTEKLYLVNDLEKNAFCIHAYDLNGKFITEDFHLHHGALGAHGAAHVTMDHTYLGWCYSFITQTLEDGRQVPGIAASAGDFGWDLRPANLGFHMSGSFWDGFIDMFKNVFEDDICDAIINKVRDELVNVVPAEINKMIAETDGAIELMPKWFMDFQSKDAPIMDGDSIMFGAAGVFYDSDFPEVTPAFPEMPYDGGNNSDVRVLVSEESVQSGLDSFLQVDPISGFFNATELPADSKVQLTTGFLEKAFKGISDYYGPDCPVDVEYNLLSIHDFKFANESSKANPLVALKGDIDLKFWVEGVNGTDLAVDLSVKDFTFEGDLHVNGNALQANITKLKAGNIKVNSDTFGKIGTFKLQMGLNVALAVLAPKIEAKLDAIALPSTLTSWLSLSDYSIAAFNGYMSVGATPTFTAPPLPPVPADAHYASTVCVENRAGFVLKFHLEDTYSGEKSSDSEHFPVMKTHCMDIKDAFPHIREGEEVNTVIKATWGKTKTANHSVTYKAEAGAFTTFTCHGTTLHYHCNDEFIESQPSVAGQANEIASLAASFFQ